MAKVEIEYKYKLNNTDEVIKHLDKNAKLKYESHQVDTYYDSPATGFIKGFESGKSIDLWLRVREENDKASINFKDYSVSNNKGFCDELESGAENPEDVKKIFERMLFAPIAVVDKTRRAYEYDDVEVSVDKVKGLGDFIEVEYDGDEEDIEKVQQQLLEALKEIGAKTAEDNDSRGYPYRIIEQNNTKAQS